MSSKMIRYFAQKFKTQVVNENEPFQEPKAENRDSGTESDDEKAELRRLEEAMQDCQLVEETLLLHLENHAPHEDYAEDTSGPSAIRNIHFPLPMSSRFSPTHSDKGGPLVIPTTLSPFHPQSSQQVLQQSDLTPHRSLDSPQDCSDFERCSLDYDPGNSTDFECPSSEEELAEAVTMDTMGSDEQQARRTVCSGSPDKEVRDLLACPPRPVEFCSSPPKGVRKIGQVVSPKCFFAKSRLSCPLVQSGLVLSPRKRQRRNSPCDSQQASVMTQRPYLVLEKMQKHQLRKHIIPHGISKARTVKVRGFNGGSRPTRAMYDSSTFCFRSINTASSCSPLTPVEEPSCVC